MTSANRLLFVAEADPQHAHCLHNVPGDWHRTQAADGGRDLHGDRAGRAQRDHITELALLHESDGARAEKSAQQTVKCRRTAASLQLAEDDDARLLAGALGELRPQFPKPPSRPPAAPRVRKAPGDRRARAKGWVSRPSNRET